MVPPVPSPKVILIGVPPLKDVKVKVVPLMPPGAAVRDAVKVGELPVLPLRPSAASALPEPEIVRSDTVTVALPEPVAAVSLSALRASALPVTERSPPVELLSVIVPAAAVEAV